MEEPVLEITEPAYVYVAGPFTTPDKLFNTRVAVSYGNEVWGRGHVPYIPHLTHYWDQMFPKPYDEWLNLDLWWLKRCDILLRIPGHSPGADKEVLFFRNRNRPVIYDVSALPEVDRKSLL